MYMQRYGDEWIWGAMRGSAALYVVLQRYMWFCSAICGEVRCA
jgi:hypothetical protein